MAKSSSIYMGEGKMALQGKWGSALSTCILAMAITMVPSFIQTTLMDLVGDQSHFFSIISLAWSIFVSMPLMYACVISLRQMHISDSSPLDTMIEKFKLNFKRYISIGIGVSLRILTAIVIPLVIYIVCMVKSFLDYGDWAVSSQSGGIAFLSIIAMVVLLFYKLLEYAFVPFLVNDHPEMMDKEIMKRSGELTKGYKWTILKINIRAILPAIAIGFGVCIILFFVALGAVFGGALASFSGYDIMNFPLTHPLNGKLVYFLCYLAFTLFLSAYIQVRVALPLSVLYSELTGYNNDNQNKQDEPVAPAPIEIADSNSNESATKEENPNNNEEKKEEPEIPYEQRYMPR